MHKAFWISRFYAHYTNKHDRKKYSKCKFVDLAKINYFWKYITMQMLCSMGDVCMYFHRKRRGAINSKQLTYLEKYRPKQRLRFKDPHNHKSKCCLMWSALSSLQLKETFTDWNYQSSAFELLLLLRRGIQPTLVFMRDPFTQGLYQLRTVKDEPLEFCLHTQTPIIRVLTNLSWTRAHNNAFWHTLVLPAITLYQQHIVQRWSWPTTCSSGSVNNEVIDQNHCMLYSRFCMKLLD